MSGPGWRLTVDIGGRSMLVSSFRAQSEEEWDSLIGLVRKLRGGAVAAQGAIQ